VIEEGTLAAVIGRRKTESGEPSFMAEKVSSADTFGLWRQTQVGT